MPPQLHGNRSTDSLMVYTSIYHRNQEARSFFRGERRGSSSPSTGERCWALGIGSPSRSPLWKAQAKSAGNPRQSSIQVPERHSCKSRGGQEVGIDPTDPAPHQPMGFHKLT